MEETERYAKRRGFKRLCLTTHDKQHFYAHIGYVPSMPVQNAGAMTAFVPMETLLRFSRMPSEDGNTQKQTRTKTNAQVLQESRDLEDACVVGSPPPSNAPPLSSIPPSPPPHLSIPPAPPPLFSPSISSPAPPPPIFPAFSIPPPPPLPLSSSIPPLPQSAGQLGVQTLTETPYRNAKGVPIYWMHKDIWSDTPGTAHTPLLHSHRKQGNTEWKTSEREWNVFSKPKKYTKTDVCMFTKCHYTAQSIKACNLW